MGEENGVIKEFMDEWGLSKNEAYAQYHKTLSEYYESLAKLESEAEDE